MLSPAFYYTSRIISNWFKSKARHICIEFIFRSSVMDNGVGEAMEDISTTGSCKSTFIAAADHVIGKGLENIQPAVDIQKKGVSTKKVVVLLSFMLTTLIMCAMTMWSSARNSM